MWSLSGLGLGETVIATETDVARITARINQLREQEPVPFSATPDDVETYLRDIAATLDEVEGESIPLTDLQERYLREGSLREVRFARARLDRDRHTALEILGRIFRLGRLPRPEGRFNGEMIGISTGLLSDPFFEWMTRIYLPWLGKTFEAATNSGDNVFEDNAWSWATSKLGWPSYRVQSDAPPNTVRLFPFRSEPAEAVEDPGLQVLKLTYSDSPNPLPVRRIVDEVVELPGGYLFGKTHMRGLRELRRIGFFGLTPAD